MSVLLPPGMRQATGQHRTTTLDGRAAVFKRRSDKPVAFFSCEAEGLYRLAASKGLRVPEVLAQEADWLLIEDLGEGQPGAGFHHQAGAGLARQHQHRNPRFGLDRAGWCGDTPQRNDWHVDGHAFFAECRLLPQLKLARDGGLLETRDARAIERICRALKALVPMQPAVLLHGDLWRGNLHCCADGQPALIDAGAVHYGWAEAELAMLTLFGTPPAAFFDAYATGAPLAPDWRARAPLYNLYHLLNHLNLFGGGYLSQVRQITGHYT